MRKIIADCFKPFLKFFMAQNTQKYKRIVIKVGSALLVEGINENSRYQSQRQILRQTWQKSLAHDLAKLKQMGIEILLVSSGAIPLGREILGIKKTPSENLELKQAASAIGQVALMRAWQESFYQAGLKIAQVLLTPQDTEERHRHLNARATLQKLLDLDVIPIINENDTVATEEVKYGDNDRLSARVASMISANLLILLSDVDGLYSNNPKIDKTAQHITKVTHLAPKIFQMAKPTNDKRATGGMVTKLQAAELALRSGCDMLILNGLRQNPLNQLFAILENIDAIKKNPILPLATLFVSDTSPKQARKKWLAGLLRPDAEIVIDHGAVLALQSGKSLLPAGAKELLFTHKKNFEKGAALVIKTRQGKLIGIGLSNYDSNDLQKLLGKNSKNLTIIFPNLPHTEIIHRDNLVLYENNN